MHVYLLWHADHADDEEGQARHQETLLGNWSVDEQAGDDAKLLGIYSTAAGAHTRIEQARSLPGFCDEPDCFLAEGYEVDRDEWAAGYLTD